MLTGLEDKCNAVCVGHILYGLSPVSAEVHDLAGYDPVLKSIRAKLIHVGDHPAGRDIVVGGHYGIRNSMTTGVLGIGMANGLRNPQGGQTAEMLFRGRRVPVMGVSLEHTTVDLSGIDEPRVGEEVMVIGEADGERVTIDDVAGWQQSTPLEVMMTLSGHLPVRAMTRSDDIWAHFQTEDRYAR